MAARVDEAYPSSPAARRSVQPQLVAWTCESPAISRMFAYLPLPSAATVAFRVSVFPSGNHMLPCPNCVAKYGNRKRETEETGTETRSGEFDGGTLRCSGSTHRCGLVC